jgi:hypothetical protein
MPIRDRTKIEVHNYGLHSYGGIWYLIQGIIDEKVCSLFPSAECPFVLGQYQSIRTCPHQVDINNVLDDLEAYLPLFEDSLIRQFLPIPALFDNRFVFVEGSTQNVPVLSQLLRMCAPKERFLNMLSKTTAKQGAVGIRGLGITNMMPYVLYGAEPCHTKQIQQFMDLAVTYRQRILIMGSPDCILPFGVQVLRPQWDKLEKLFTSFTIPWERLGATVCREFMMAGQAHEGLMKLVPEMKLSLGEDNPYESTTTSSSESDSRSGVLPTESQMRELLGSSSGEDPAR